MKTGHLNPGRNCLKALKKGKTKEEHFITRIGPTLGLWSLVIHRKTQCVGKQSGPDGKKESKLGLRTKLIYPLKDRAQMKQMAEESGTRIKRIGWQIAKILCAFTEYGPGN